MTRISGPQPEEEAEESLLQKNFDTDEAVNNSRLSLPEPEIERQPHECRFVFPKEDLDLEGEPVEADDTAEPSCLTESDGEEPADAEEEEPSDGFSLDVAGEPALDDSFELADRPKPGEEGMPRGSTMLYLFEQNELNRHVHITVPEGMGPERVVSFVLENKKHDVQIPEGFLVGQQVLVQVPKRPPLERNPTIAWCRGHANFPDRVNILEPLKHNSRADSNAKLDHPEFVHRRWLYSLLRGSSMSPLLAMVEEGGEERMVDEA